MFSTATIKSDSLFGCLRMEVTKPGRWSEGRSEFCDLRVDGCGSGLALQCVAETLEGLPEHVTNRLFWRRREHSRLVASARPSHHPRRASAAAALMVLSCARMFFVSQEMGGCLHLIEAFSLHALQRSYNSWNPGARGVEAHVFWFAYHVNPTRGTGVGRRAEASLRPQP